MATKLRVYLDTSVFSAYFDDRVRDRQAATEEFWQRLGDFEISTSTVAQEELLMTVDENLRSRLKKLLSVAVVHALTHEMRELALRYIREGIFTAAMANDALHVAAAVLTRQDVLVSWNFRHLVNRRRRAQIAEVDTRLGLPAIEIVAPPEL